MALRQVSLSPLHSVLNAEMKYGKRTVNKPHQLHPHLLRHLLPCKLIIRISVFEEEGRDLVSDLLLP